MSGNTVTKIVFAPSYSGEEARKERLNLVYQEARVLRAFERTPPPDFNVPVATQNMDLGNAVLFYPGDGIDFVDVPHSFINEETRKGLARAKLYFEANIQGGNVHGDFHVENILEQRGQATGLIDFPHTGFAPNKFIDIAFIQDDFRDDVVDGYEKESGTCIKYIVAATRMAIATNYLVRARFNEDRQEEWMPCIKKGLKILAPVLSSYDV